MATVTAVPIRVMLVDDHEMLLRAVARALTEEPDIEMVAAVGTGREALRAARLGVDVAVVDYVLPDGDGITLATELLAGAPGVRVLLLTGSGGEHLFLRAMEAGCSGYLTKDRGLPDLVEAITTVARDGLWVPPSLVGHLLPRSPGAAVSGGELTAREMEVLRLAAEGLSNAAIAEELFLSVNTVRNHVQSAIGKLGAHSKLEAVSVAVRQGIISFP